MCEFITKEKSMKIIKENGDIEYRNSKFQLHRLDGPAKETAGGSKYWYKNGLVHRIGGPAVEYTDGSKYWYCEGKEHRLDGPAIEWQGGTKEWWVNGKLHRLYGPAVKYSNANVSDEWFLKNESYTKSEHNRLCLFFILEPRRIDLGLVIKK
jgi:hypothetical protein